MFFLQEKFAFESDKVSIAFRFMHGLGDAVVARKVFNAIVELAPDCLVDIFCMRDYHPEFAKAFYGDSKNLNLISDFKVLQEKNSKSYDLSLWVMGTHAVILDAANVERLQNFAPKLLQTAELIERYYQENVQAFQPWSYSVPLRNVMMSHVLNKNFHWFLSCGGVLNINQDGAWLKPLPEYKNEFDKLRLGNYISIYSNMSADKNIHKIKSWSMDYLVEYVGLLKKFFPILEIVQVGSGDDREIENVDKNFLGCGLELTKHILANSLLHVGCEGGLIHLATALGTKCLVLFGMSDRQYFGYPQNINIASKVCSPCLYLEKDYLCARGFINTPCMLNIKPQEIFIETCEYLKTLEKK